ncbi:MAG TPA: GspE/PulE family protein, partial [Fibrobacteraceae bacterium]|nr:GspE/PulE family protein [Fibrobacteraceae bacterium]
DAAWEARPVIRLVEGIINEALRQLATDIHVEPEEDSLKIRFRRDGMLRQHLVLPGWVKPAVIGRLKVMSNLDIAEKRLPQDGRIGWDWKGGEVDIRVSSLPTRFGEKVVLRLLRQVVTLQRLDNLGMPTTMKDRLEYFFKRPQGMIFVTGPTGSGKSSTLFAGLQHILNQDINITTIEDPIEYDLPGANQVQINEKAGLTFASALRSILRQDPDVILVGEIRDPETAHIAVQAAQTGHLVLSTLHTNDSISAITRLKDLGIEPFLIGSAVLCVMAQRLVRKLCKHCMQWDAPSEELRRMIPDLPDRVPRPIGCPACGHTGYRGRVAVFEMLTISPEVRSMILSNVSEGELRRSLHLDPLLSDGFAKMNEGLTSPEEIVRVLLSEVHF